MKFKDLSKHHAILIVSENRQELSKSLWNEISDVFTPNRLFEQTVLDIDTVRNLISWSNTPFAGLKRAIISFHTATLPAQNAMLKVLEEPRGGVSFILITSNKSDLIPTFTSRLHEVKNQESRNEKEEVDVSEFFTTKPQDRMKLEVITEVLGKEDEEGRKDKEALKKFISALIKYGRENNLRGEKLIKLIEMESYSTDPSASPKMILEFLSLILPRVV